MVCVTVSIPHSLSSAAERVGDGEIENSVFSLWAELSCNMSSLLRQLSSLPFHECCTEVPPYCSCATARTRDYEWVWRYLCVRVSVGINSGGRRKKNQSAENHQKYKKPFGSSRYHSCLSGDGPNLWAKALFFFFLTHRQTEKKAKVSLL